jgi:hypothetical protein
LSFLIMSWCNQSTITDGAFEYLSNLSYLRMAHCSQESISARAFICLSKLSYLNIAHCPQLKDTIAEFTSKQLQVDYMYGNDEPDEEQISM